MTTQAGDLHLVHSDQEANSDWWAVQAIVMLCVAGLAVTQLNPQVLASDPFVYRLRASEVFAGLIPYFDFPFEHFPVAILPMLFAWVAGGAVTQGIYQFVFAALMVACLGGTARLLRSAGPSYHVDHPDRTWLPLILPLLPIVIFRSEPWIVFLFVAGLTATVLGQQSKALVAGVAAIFGKGWPVVLAPIAWSKGARRNAVVFSAVGLASVVLLALLPGFRDGRQFSGLHTESVVGGFLALMRIIRGETIGRIDAAGATYLEAGPESLILQLAIGVVIAVIALVRIDRFDLRSATCLASALVAAILVGTPLLSPQFLLWLTPLVALVGDRISKTLLLGVGWLSLGYLAGLIPDLDQRPWVAYVLNIRNGLLLVLAVYLAFSVARPADAHKSEQSTASWHQWAIWATVAVGTAWLALAIAHSADLFYVDHASRVRVALAHSAQSGGLYPMLFDGTSYGGTRFMPLPLVIHAWLGDDASGLVPAGKALTYLSVVATALIAFGISRGRKSIGIVTLAVLALWLLSPAGLITTLGIRWDAFALALQLAAIGVVGRYWSRGGSQRRWSLAVAAVLCALAFLAKTSAVWACLAITAWLLPRSWKRALTFIGGYIACVVVGVLVADQLLHGTLVPNIRDLSAIGMEGGFSPGRSIQRFWAYSQAKMPIAAAILTIGAVSILRTARATHAMSWRARLADLDLSQWAFLFAVLATLFVMSDFGIAENHFIDFAVLGAILAAGTPTSQPGGWLGERRQEAQIASLALCLFLTVSFLPAIGADLGAVVARDQRTTTYSVDLLDDLVPSDRTVFSEDPLIHVLRDETPPVLDSWMFKRMVERRLVPSEPLVADIRNSRFDYLVLWNWEPEAVGDYLTADVRQAIGDVYTLCGNEANLNVYRPRQMGC